MKKCLFKILAIFLMIFSSRMVDAKLRGNTMTHSCLRYPIVAKMNEPITLFISYDSIEPEEISVSINVSAYKAVEPDSDVNDLELIFDESLLQVAKVETRKIPYTIILKDEGEFDVEYQLNFKNGVTRSFELSVIARDGFVAVSGAGFRDCEWLLLMNKYGLDLDTKYDELPKLKERKIKAERSKINTDRSHKNYEFYERKKRADLFAEPRVFY